MESIEQEIQIDTEQAESEPAYQVKIDQFEGPLPLLLEQVKKEILNIIDIRISHITEQYLQHLEEAKQPSLTATGEFLVLTSTLIYIKTRQLLPMTPDTPPLEIDDDLLPFGEDSPLLAEYQQLKEVARQLETYQHQWREVYGWDRQPQSQIETSDDEASVLEGVTLYDLFNAFQVVMSKTTKRVFTIRRDPWEVKDGINLILKQLTDNVTVTFSDLFPIDADLGLVIVVFLGLLELIRRGRIRAFQEPEHGPILVSLTT
ncbi:MAG TPA: hypothetical protein EYO65_01175 [Nitrospirales bacterium]|nr:hypothetical protein [Nitrospirales bacterium]